MPHGSLPARVIAVALIERQARFKDRAAFRQGRQIVDRFPHAQAQSRQQGCAARGRFLFGGAHQRNPQPIGLNLACDIRIGQAAAHAELLDVQAGAIVDCFQNGAQLIADRIEKGARHVRPIAAQRQPENRRACAMIVVGHVEAGKGRHDDHIARIGHRFGQRVELCFRFKPVTALQHPAHCRARDGRIGFKAVSMLEVESWRLEVRRFAWKRPRVIDIDVIQFGRRVSRDDVDERRRAVRAFSMTGMTAAVPEERRLLIADHRDDGHVGFTRSRVDAQRAVIVKRGRWIGQTDRAKLQPIDPLGPISAMAKIPQTCFLRQRIIVNVPAGSAQRRDQPTGRHADADVIASQRSLKFRLMPRAPGQVHRRAPRAGKITQPIAPLAGVVPRFQLSDEGQRAQVLPRDGIDDGLTGARIPDEIGAALRSDTDGGDVRRRAVGGAQRQLDRLRSTCRDGARVLLDPIGPQADQLGGHVTESDAAAVKVHEIGFGAAGALIKSKKIFHNSDSKDEGCIRQPTVAARRTWAGMRNENLYSSLISAFILLAGGLQDRSE